MTSFGIRRLPAAPAVGHRAPPAASKVGIALNRYAPWLTRFVNTCSGAADPGRVSDPRPPGAPVHPALRRQHAGKQVHIWTVDDSESIAELIDAGADGIFTDRIDTLKTVLEQRSLWTGAEAGQSEES